MSSSSGYVRSSQRASISPLRSRKSPVGPAKPAGRPTTPSSSSTSSRPSTKASISSVAAAAVLDVNKAKENVSVTGDEVAWYADGDHIVRNEYNPSIAYGFDKVFGPATTTRHVYDVAAHHVVSGAMEGINGAI
ncbi:Kinesin-like protein [Vigna angularis]|uniref:Kinesin-like protein n=1 Tax=Phaseolus angularis TaxID=3914 RepID=A0A8T0JYR5_PHAAN|nr:Kinesin-like protein [Vigna angularis]